ncbi:MAG: hypothetical protein JSS02_30525 [Planctomycetes bacterium]|nr:hypothetical protein [Planctomycetota bacterium]
MRHLLLILVMLGGISRLVADEPADISKSNAQVSALPAPVKSYLKQGWLVQETDSFRVFCAPQLPEAPRLPATCEALRRQLLDTWSVGEPLAWQPRCDIVVHSTVAGYSRELGLESRQSSGCATIELSGKQVKKRRVDLRADAADWLTTALPHELTHVVLADQFASQQIPRWVDEGIAILAEPASRQAQRRQALQRALTHVPRLTAQDLMALRDYPTGARRDLFYGESAALVAWLVERDSPARFLEFVQASQTQGWQRALTDIYHIESTAELDRLWQKRGVGTKLTVELYARRIANITSGLQLD